MKNGADRPRRIIRIPAGWPVCQRSGFAFHVQAAKVELVCRIPGCLLLRLLQALRVHLIPVDGLQIDGWKSAFHHQVCHDSPCIRVQGMGTQGIDDRVLLLLLKTLDQEDASLMDFRR